MLNEQRGKQGETRDAPKAAASEEKKKEKHTLDAASFFFFFLKSKISREREIASSFASPLVPIRVSLSGDLALSKI